MAEDMGLTAADQKSISLSYQANMEVIYAEILKRGMFSWQQQWNGQSSPTAKNGCCTSPLVKKGSSCAATLRKLCAADSPAQTRVMNYAFSPGGCHTGVELRPLPPRNYMIFTTSCPVSKRRHVPQCQCVVFVALAAHCQPASHEMNLHELRKKFRAGEPDGARARHRELSARARALRVPWPRLARVLADLRGSGTAELGLRRAAGPLQGNRRQERSLHAGVVQGERTDGLQLLDSDHHSEEVEDSRVQQTVVIRNRPAAAATGWEISKPEPSGEAADPTRGQGAGLRSAVQLCASTMQESAQPPVVASELRCAAQHRRTGVCA